MNDSKFHKSSRVITEELDTQVGSFVALIGLAGLVFVHQACAPPQTADKSTTIIEEVETSVMVDLLSGVGSNVILPTLAEFETEVAKLEESLQQLESSYGNRCDKTFLPRC